MYFMQDVNSWGKNSTNNLLFIETEKLALNTGVSSAADASNSNEDKMVFNFFGEKLETKPSATVYPMLTTSTHQNLENVLNSSTMISSIPTEAADCVPYEPLEDISFKAIIDGAFQFRQEKYDIESR